VTLIDVDRAKKLIFFLSEVLQKEFGFRLQVGIELEFFLKGSFSLESFSQYCNMEVIPERGNGQYEVNLEYSSDIELMIRRFYKAKKLLESAAILSNVELDFSPKPFLNDYGSGAHYNLSLIDNNDKNIFSLSNSEHILNSIISSILELTNDSIYLMTGNSEIEFLRFVPGFMAPVNISWGGNNRTTLIRIPDSKLNERRIEFRLPSSRMKLEYVLLFLLVAVIEGLRDIKEPPPKIYGNANDKQYNLEVIHQNITQAKKYFRFDKIIDNYDFKN
jgi:glutamine synthetase